MKRFLYELPSYLFSIIEGILIFIIGYYLIQLDYDQILFIMVTFMLVRKNAEKPCHYKSLVKCIAFTLIIFGFLFIVAKINFTISLVITVVAANMLTEKGDIRDTFEHFNRGKEKKYIYIEKYIENHKETIGKTSSLIFEILKGYRNDSTQISYISICYQLTIFK